MLIEEYEDLNFEQIYKIHTQYDKSQSNILFLIGIKCQAIIKFQLDGGFSNLNEHNWRILYRKWEYGALNYDSVTKVMLDCRGNFQKTYQKKSHVDFFPMSEYKITYSLAP